WRSLRRDTLRYRGCVLEPSRRQVLVRHNGRGVRPRDRTAPAPCHHRAWRRYRALRSRPAGGRPARSIARAVALVHRRSQAARSRHVALRRVLSLVPRRRRRGAQLAVGEAGEALVTAVGEAAPPVPTVRPTLAEATRVWARIGVLSFGGPAG